VVALKLKEFGGMIPAVDPRLLPENQAASSENSWLYTGALEGIRDAVSVHTLANPLAGKAFRIPIKYYDKDHIPDSYWMEFIDPDTDVVSSPTVDDTYDRFYWASPTSIPQYNTRERIVAGNPAFTLGIPTPSVAPRVSRVNSTYFFDCGPLTYKVTAGSTHLYETRAYGVDHDTFFSGLIDDVDYGSYGATQAIKGSGGVSANVDKSKPVVSGGPVNRYTSTGFSAELRYGTVSNGQRITVSDEGYLTVGIPSQSTSEPAYTGQGVLETRAYVYTWVSAYGEEGPPSPPTLNTAWSGDPWFIKVTAPTSTDTTNRNLAKVRIYRTVTGVAGTTTYFLVTEMDIASTSYQDVLSDDTVTANSILESDFWEAPPSDLDGMTPMPNGMIAGFRDNEVWFCEPYRPHAWPSPYTLAVDAPIVGLGVIGQTLMVLTTGSPYAITGINPSQMAVSRLKKAEPCLSRGSIVSSPNGVLYCSPNGLAVATPGDVTIASQAVVTKDHWLDLVNGPSLRACQLGGAYYAWGSVQSGCFEQSAFETSAFLQTDFSGAYEGILFDLVNQRVSFNTLTTDTPTYNTYVDTWTGEVLMIRGGEVLWLDISDKRTHGPYKWKSKIFEMPNKRNLEAMRVWFSTYPTTPTLNPVPVINPASLASDMWGIVRVYADDRLVYTREIRSSGEFFRLPSGFRATFWQIEVEARVQINNIEVATTAKELMSV